MNDPRPLMAASFLLIGGALFTLSRRAHADVLQELPPPDQEGDAPPVGIVDYIGAALDSVAIDAQATFSDLGEIVNPTPNAETNLAAFLLAIRMAEGTSGPNGYRTLFGGGLFDSFADHPRRRITASMKGKTITSTAAGAYQALAGTWDDFVRSQGPHDFSPASQDQFAVWAIRRRGALADVRAGRFDVAANKVRQEWASFPGAGYGQPEKSLVAIRNAYQAAGGTLA